MADSNSILPAELQHLAIKQPEEQSSSGNDLNQADFLELMLTQIQHQDPLNPADSSEFSSQLAQFSTATGIEDLNDSFSNLATSMQSSQALQASTMVGNTVLVPGNQFSLSSDGFVSGAIELDTSTSNLVINISDASGQSVRQVDFGTQSSGLTKFSWDGLDNNGNALPEGQYKIEAAAVVNGEAVAQTILVNARVDSVSLSKTGGEPLLNLNGLGSVNMNDVREIM